MENLNTYQVFQQQKRRLLLVLVLFLFAAFPSLQTAVTESRAYRDMMHATAYHSVTLIGIQSVGPDAIKVWGSFIKRRCTFIDATAYTSKLGVSRLAHLNYYPTGTEPRVINRPPMAEPQAWGPWQITSQILDPDSFAIYTRHDCPNEHQPQVNLFVEALWPPPVEE